MTNHSPQQRQRRLARIRHRQVVAWKKRNSELVSRINKAFDQWAAVCSSGTPPTVLDEAANYYRFAVEKQRQHLEARP